jgi:hypothetical protein
VNLGLAGWVLLLQRRNQRLEGALEGAFMMMRDLADGEATITKTAEGFVVRRVKNGL